MTYLYKVCSFFVLITFVAVKTAAQTKASGYENKSTYALSYFGIGAGLDYGGFGLKGEFLPSKYVGVFGGIGYNLVDPAYNFGLSLKVLPDKKVTPIVLAMYGYNAAIRIVGGFMSIADLHHKTYYGPTVGAGAEIKYGIHNNKISLSLLVPFRNSSFHDDYDNFRNRTYPISKILPVAFSAGVNFAIDKRTGKK